MVLIFNGGDCISTVGSSQIWVLARLFAAVASSDFRLRCLECLENPTVNSSWIELKFGRGIPDLFI